MITRAEAFASARRLAEDYRSAPRRFGERAEERQRLEAAADWTGLARYQSQQHPDHVVVVTVQPACLHSIRPVTSICYTAKSAFKVVRNHPTGQHYIARNGIVLMQPKDGAS